MESEGLTKQACLIAFVATAICAPAYGSTLTEIQIWGKSFESLNQAMNEVQAHQAVQNLTQKKENRLAISDRLIEADIATTRFQAFYKGVEVVGSMALHHKTGEGSEITSYVADFDLSTQPALSELEAVAVARNLVGNLELENRPQLKILPRENGKEGSADLVYWITFKSSSLQQEGREVILNAQSGEIMANLPRRFHIEHQATRDHRPSYIQIYQANQNCQQMDPTGNIVSYDENLCDLMVYGDSNGEHDFDAPNAQAMQAFGNSLRVLNYYSQVHGRSSFDNRGADLKSIVNIGHRYNNAFWDGERNVMAYGAGDGVQFRSFTAALDVAGHEMTHGVISKTANLVYRGESGALNEAFADFFGVMIARDYDWNVGEDLFIKGTGRGIRDLRNPRSLSFYYGTDAEGEPVYRPYPAHMKEKLPNGNFCGPANDYCWVHINSTIFGHATYLASARLGPALAEKIFYRAMAHFLGPMSQFKDAALASLKACLTMNLRQPACSALRDVFVETGLLDSNEEVWERLR